MQLPNDHGKSDDGHQASDYRRNPTPLLECHGARYSFRFSSPNMPQPMQMIKTNRILYIYGRNARSLQNSESSWPDEPGEAPSRLEPHRQASRHPAAVLHLN